ncbi:MAG: lipoate protein ligase C-terminal domain-containing protein [Desulfurococcaceae archaeon TW002]
MITCSTTKRLSGGKTIKVDLEVTNEIIKNIVISGDFFLYPEEYIHIIESELREKKVSEVHKILNKFKNSVEIVSASIEEFAEAIIETYRTCISG